ncbi:MAG TPA: arsenate reductase ArsC [Thermoanaerobaculia bacterium]|nr:arsenate reductase ArsC [Thermoanaerobaculia bacterium]
MEKAKQKLSVMFLCTGNAARSQMAEALTRLDHGEIIEPFSAGSKPTGWVHPLAVKAMEALGADMSSARSKHASELMDRPLDLVVTVCDSAAADCPVWPKAVRMEHWPIVDPSWGEDDPLTRYDRFLATRDELRSRINGLVASLVPR